MLTNVVVLTSIPKDVQFDWFVTQPYAVSLGLAFGGLLVNRANHRVRQVLAAVLMSLAHWVNLATILAVLPFVLAAGPQRRARLRTVGVGFAAGVLVAALFGGGEPAPMTFAAVRLWPVAWSAFALNTFRVVGEQGRRVDRADCGCCCGHRSRVAFARVSRTQSAS